jgi:chitin synthase
MPLYQFLLPLYAFWHFDDFTWGSTRIVQNDGINSIQGEFDEDLMILEPWTEYHARHEWQ